MTALQTAHKRDFVLARDARTLLNTLYKVQNGYCAYCGNDTEFPRRSMEPCEANDATIDHILPRSNKGEDQPYNLLMACFRCNQEKRSKPLMLFMVEKLPMLSGEARARIIEVEERLLRYFYPMAVPGKKGPVNEYVGLGLARMFRADALKSADAIARNEERRRLENASDVPVRPAVKTRKAAEKPVNVPAVKEIPVQVAVMPEPVAEPIPAVEVPPVAVEEVLPASVAPVEEPPVQVAAVPEPVAEPVPAAEVPPEEEGELEECVRLTRELQELIPKAYPGHVVRALNVMERVVNSPFAEVRIELLSALGASLWGIYEADAMYEDLPEARKYGESREPVLFDHDNQLPLSPIPATYAVIVAQMQVQRMMATVNRLERKMLDYVLNVLLAHWESPALITLALSSAEYLVNTRLKLEQCYATHPRLRGLTG